MSPALSRGSEPMMARERIKVARFDRIAAGGATAIATGKLKVALFNADGRMFATDDACLRCGRSLASGTLVGTLVCCAGCGWQYDIATGGVCGLPALRIETYRVTVHQFDVMLEVWSE